MTTLRILGDGGLAREVEALAKAMGDRWGVIQRLNPDDEPVALAFPGDVALGMGSPAARQAAADRWTSTDLTWPALVHPNAQVGPRCTVGIGAGLQTGVVLTTDVTIGDFTYLNLVVTVGHGVQIGRCCLLNPAANVSGGVTIGDGVLVGAGAVVLENLTIGEGATIGAGAVVTHDVPARTTVVGVPAKPIGQN